MGSVFLINVPLVAVSLLAALLLIPAPGDRPDRDWDLVGSIQVMAGLIGFAYVVEELGSPRPPYAVMAAAAVATAIILIVFVRRQLGLKSPLIDFTLFRNREFTLSVITAIVASLAIAGTELALTALAACTRLFAIAGCPLHLAGTAGGVRRRAAGQPDALSRWSRQHDEGCALARRL